MLTRNIRHCSRYVRQAASVEEEGAVDVMITKDKTEEDVITKILWVFHEF